MTMNEPDPDMPYTFVLTAPPDSHGWTVDDFVTAIRAATRALATETDGRAGGKRSELGLARWALLPRKDATSVAKRAWLDSTIPGVVR